MPDLSNTKRWLEYEPDLLGNRESQRPFFFLLNGSLTHEELRQLRQAVERRPLPAELPADAAEEQRIARAEEARAELVSRYAAALDPHVRVGAEPLSVDGQPIETLKAYLDFVSSKLTGLRAFLEPWEAVMAANTLDGRSSFSSGRLSGGFTTTARSRVSRVAH